MKPSFHERWRRVQSRVAAEVTRLTSKLEARKPKTEIDQSLLTSAATVLKVARWSGWLGALWPMRVRWRRYRVTPRANPAKFRRELRRSIRDELRASGFHLPRVSCGTTL